MARIGYARVSTIDQGLDNQVARLKLEGCGVIRAEKVSGGSRDGRTELATIIEFLRPEDELVVTRLDRLGRDTRDVLNIIHECDQRRAFVTVLDPHVSTRGEAGRIVLTVLGMVAQMERRFIKERQREGIIRAKANGAYQGGKRRIDYQEIHRLSKAGNGPAAIARVLGCSRMQVHRVLLNQPDLATPTHQGL
jgi:DNA invertase Pin-like site-specific DNA recombinase